MKKQHAKAVAVRAALGAFIGPQLAADAAPVPLKELAPDGASCEKVAADAAKHYAKTLTIDKAKLAASLQAAVDAAMDGAPEDDDEKDDKKKDDKDGNGKGRANDDDKGRTASDEALVKQATDAAVAEARRGFQAIRAAEDDVRPLVGDLAAMDSAGEVYRTALKQLGHEQPATLTDDALPSIFAVVKRQAETKRQAEPLAANDAASLDAEVKALFPNMTKPRRA